ncbi:hypothetical protein ABPG72_015341 [Tetrahymena utriculariae]
MDIDNNENLSQKSRISNESQYVNLKEITQTRRIFLIGDNIREFSVILQNRVKTKVKLQVLPSSSPNVNLNVNLNVNVNVNANANATNKGVINFKSVVLTNTIQRILHESGLDLVILASKSSSTKLNNQFLSSQSQFSSQPASSSSSSSFCEEEFSQKSSSQQLNPLIYDEKMVNDIAQKLTEINQQQQQQKWHQCISEDCCSTLLEMAKNQNKKQITSHLYRVLMRNSWCIHQLMDYVDKQVLDKKLNEQVFEIIVEKINEIKNVSDTIGNLNICQICQEQKSKSIISNLPIQKSLIQDNIQNNCQQSLIMQQQQYLGQQFSFIRTEQNQQSYIQPQQQQQQFYSSLNQQEVVAVDYQQHLKQVQSNSVQKFVKRHEDARQKSRSQSPYNTTPRKRPQQASQQMQIQIKNENENENETKQV